MSRLYVRPRFALIALALVSAPVWAQSTDETRDLQRVLNTERSGVGLGSIAEDGILGPRTRGAVRNLQHAAGLPVTGVADRVTQSVAQQGRREAVRALQRALNRERALQGLPAIDVDGKFGSESYQAVGDFQRRHGLQWTGRMNARARAELRTALGTPAPTTPAPTTPAPTTGGGSGGGGLVTGLGGPASPTKGGPRLARGARRKASLLQTRLNDYRRATGLPRISVDGSYGPQTEAAVKALQASKTLPQTGVVDTRTWNELVAATSSGPLGPINPAAYPVSGASYKRSNSSGANVEIHRLDPIAIGASQRSPLVFESRMTVDADGAGNAWKSDPWGQPTTSLIYPNGTSLNPTTLNYFVLPIGFDARHPGVRLGDVAAVIYRGRVAYAIYGDRGPRAKIGEGSIALARALGIPSSPINGGAAGGVVYMVFPGSGTGRPLSQAELNARGARLLRAAGGRP